MKSIQQCLLLALGSVAMAQSASASVITFDGAASTWQTAYDTSQVDVVFQSPAYAWGSGYNNLSNVAYGNSGGSLVIDFVALGDSIVTLSSFDLGNYLGRGGALSYSVYDLNDLILPLITQLTTVAYTNSAHPTYNVGLSSTAGLRLTLGPDLYNNAVDNIVFSAADVPTATVPEPTSLALVLAALGAALLPLSRKSRA